MAEAGGVLVLVGTPIGNVGDLTPGADQALRRADVVCAEDTRRSGLLLAAAGIRAGRLHSVRAHNEVAQAQRVVRWVAEGRVVAYVTDAGMPTVSDPGERLTRAVLAAGGRVEVAAGPDAATAALLLRGFPRDRWAFEGFLPTKGTARRERLDALAAEPRTAVLYEAPHRLLRTLADLVSTLGPDRAATVVNDMTKRYERTWRGPLSRLRDDLAAAEPQGEFAVVLAPPA